MTSFQHTAAVTEIGRAGLIGHSQCEQAANLIEHAAHPDTRAQLREPASLLAL